MNTKNEREFNETLPAKCECVEQSTCSTAVTMCQSLGIQSKGLIQEYLCTGKINEELFQYEDVREFLVICNSIHGLSTLKQVCANKLLQSLNKENLYEIFDIADEFEIPDVIKKCADEIVKSIDNFSGTRDFLSLRSSQMKALVRSRCCKETILLRDALCEWWKNDPETRGEVYETLREKVAGNAFPSKSFQGCDCKAYLVMFAITKSGDHHSTQAKVFNIGDEKTYKVHIEEADGINKGYDVCCSQAGATEPPYVFIFGQGTKSLKFLSCDVIMNKWKVCPPMKFPRIHHVMECVNGNVYALGGSTCKGSNVSQIEEFDRKQNSWSVIGHLKWRVRSPLSIANNNRIYLFGGKNDEGENVSVIQYCDVEDKTVDIEGYLPVECSGGRAILTGHSIYIATEQGQLMKYSIEKKRSVMLKDPPQKRAMFGLFLRHNEIHMVGGRNESGRAVDFDLVYSISEDAWIKAACIGGKSFEVFGQCLMMVPNEIPFSPFC
jgi:hypothetical protein